MPKIKMLIGSRWFIEDEQETFIFDSNDVIYYRVKSGKFILSTTFGNYEYLGDAETLTEMYNKIDSMVK